MLRALIVLVLALLIGADPLLADPFGTATQAAQQVQQGLTRFALVVGGVGMVACLLLGFFGKLSWKWVATGIGVSFGIAIVPAAINWLAGLGR